MFSINKMYLATVVAAAIALVSSGCGNSSGTPMTTVTGQAVAGAVDGTVTVLNASGTALASAAVVDGAFTVAVPGSAVSGELEFVVTGTYTDEVSGATVTLTTANPLALRAAAGVFLGGGNAPVTPDSTVIRELAAHHGMTLTQARAAFQNAFGYQPSASAVPFDPAMTDSASAASRPTADRDAAFRAGVFSQLATDLGLTGNDIAALARALADDLADGALDGAGGTGPVVVGTVDLATQHNDNPLAARLLAAHGGFAGSAANNAGLAAPSMGLPSMPYDAPGTTLGWTTRSGRNIDVTLDTVAQAPFSAGFWTARVAHKVTLADAGGGAIDIATDTGGGTGFPIVKVSHHPMMHMLSGHDHSTPHSHTADTTDAANGNYVLDAYYVMASGMGGMPMGVWDYVVNITEDTNNSGTADAGDLVTPVMFHPEVMMPMAMMGGADVFVTTVSNAADTWTTMTGTTQPRPYKAWLHQAVNNNDGTHQVTVFVSTQNMADMSMGMGGMSHDAMTFPAVYAGAALNGPVDGMGMRPAVTLSTVAVELSADGGNTWAAAVADGTTGRYTAAALAGLDPAMGQDALDVRLTVDGNVMQTSGGADGQLLFSAP